MRTGLVVLLFGWLFECSTGQPQDAQDLQLVSYPAQIECRTHGSYYDSALRACVSIDKSQSMMPEFDECPIGSELDGYNCVGEIQSDYELYCPQKDWRPNASEECMKAITYSPPKVVCPEGFLFHRVGKNSEIRICMQEKWSAPLEVPIQKSFLEAQGYPTEMTELNCLPGSKLEVRKNKKACVSRIIISPDSEKTCIEGYRYTSTYESCIKLEAYKADKVCPRPNYDFGPGFGDWETPRYEYHPLKKCVADMMLATGAKCLPGWHLEGQVKRTCYKKIILPPEYNCNNLQGFAFRCGR
eukprot:GHVU01158818.1.p1 GENE.GHVU01158818.1~~GHVU01158818.1.p1  ORF type:complete len:324 (-),score=19.00 GHVU01158818.1:957-1853(-)